MLKRPLADLGNIPRRLFLASQSNLKKALVCNEAAQKRAVAKTLCYAKPRAVTSPRNGALTPPSHFDAVFVLSAAIAVWCNEGMSKSGERPATQANRQT